MWGTGLFPHSPRDPCFEEPASGVLSLLLMEPYK